jgi:signal transduction histidine kinase/DNA-binding NarL/FixJ family response regulator
MKRLLVITNQPTAAEAIRVCLDAKSYAVIAEENVSNATAILSSGLADAVLLDAELTDVHAIRAIDEINTVAPNCPLLVLASQKQWEWEEDAFVRGVAQVLAKPVRARMLNAVLNRLLAPTAVVPEKTRSEESASRIMRVEGAARSGPFQSLSALRSFSGVLTHSLQTEALLKEFLLRLREAIGVNRAAIFLRKPAAVIGGGESATAEPPLESACAIGIEPALLRRFTLSLEYGIGRHARKHGRILRASSSETGADSEVHREFQALGVETAVPILDRETLLGVAVLDDRLTGEAYSSEELALIFHMLEELGLAVRNSWQHDELSASHSLIADIFANLECGCILVGAGPCVLQFNAAARHILLPGDTGKRALAFQDLPQELGSKAFGVIQSGTSVPAFRYQFRDRPDAHYRVTVNPFKPEASGAANAALLLIEDITQAEKAQRLEVEASNLRLITSMAEHLAHEIGNSLVPISTHQQLLEDKFEDREFRESLSEALASGVKRISRLANQMVFLAREKTDFADKIRISELIVEAFREAHTFFADKIARLNFDKSSEPWVVAGDHKALRHAFSEVMLNALQANPDDPNVAVHVEETTGEGGRHVLNVEVRDAGKGFTDETAHKAPDPFFSTRTVGLGLGLTVTRKIIESHHGRIQINPSREGEHGVVRISLPLSQ